MPAHHHHHHHRQPTRGCPARVHAEACACAVPHYYVKEDPGIPCASTCQCDGARVCRSGRCRGVARPKLYAPLAHTPGVDATLKQRSALQADSFGSSLAPMNDGCVVALYNYTTHGDCPPADTCEDIAAACAAMFAEDTDIARCVRANSFDMTPGGAEEQWRSLEELNRKCCGDVADPMCDKLIASQACHWDPLLKKSAAAHALAPPGGARCCSTQAQQILEDAAARRDGVRFGDFFFAPNLSLFSV